MSMTNSALGELKFCRPSFAWIYLHLVKAGGVLLQGSCFVLFRLGDQCKDPHRESLQRYESMKAGSCSQKLEFHSNKVNGLILSSYARKINL